MATYTYDQFLSDAKSSGLLSQFSQADLNLAKDHPDFGESILSLKKQYAGATTEEQKALIYAQANDLRKSYGNYTIDTGGNYVSAGAAPANYQSAYGDALNEALDKVTSREAFSYDPAEDENYSAYRKQYLREGQRASADALGQAAANTGGIASTAAVTAASQAGDYYATQLADKVPELYQQAYERYLQEYSMDQSALSTLQGQDETEYSRYLDQISNQQTTTQQALENASAADETAYSRKQDAWNNAMAIISAGVMPDAALLSAAGIDAATAQSVVDAVKVQNAAAAAKGTKTAGGTEEEDEEEDTETGKKKTTVPTSTFGTMYSSIWKNARSMQDAGKSDDEIAEYLDRFNEKQLTAEGLDYIMQQLNIHGVREV